MHAHRRHQVDVVLWDAYTMQHLGESVDHLRCTYTNSCMRHRLPMKIRFYVVDTFLLLCIKRICYIRRLCIHTHGSHSLLEVSDFKGVISSRGEWLQSHWLLGVSDWESLAGAWQGSHWQRESLNPMTTDFKLPLLSYPCSQALPLLFHTVRTESWVYCCKWLLIVGACATYRVTYFDWAAKCYLL